MASGDVVNTASRLQAAAPVNGILVDETTYRSTERAIVFEKTDPVEAKGKRDLVVVWKPLEARARFGADLEAPRTPLVGRERERELLTATLERVKNERSVQLLTLVGVPGIGKSRLVAELFQVISDSPELVTWRQGRSLPYGEGVTYWALGEMIKNQAGILETDDSAKAGQKLHDEVARLFGDDREAGSVETKLRSLVGIETAAAQTDDTRQENFYAWRRFFEELADSRPAVLVFEDLHWADDGSARLHRPSGRLGRRHSVVVCLHGQARALRSSSGLGRRQTERFDDLAFSAFGRGDRQAAHGAARAHGASCRAAGGSAPARRGQPPVCRAVRPHARRAW